MFRHKASLTGFLLAFLVLTVLFAVAATAAQFTCIDEDYVHNKWYYHESFPWQPSNWTSPENYAAGTAYFRVEVRSLDKPIDGWYTTNTNQSSSPDFTADLFAPQLCLFQDSHIPSKHACFYSGTIEFNEPGVYYGSQSLPDMYQYGVIDWTRLLMNPMIIGKVRGPSGLSYSGQNVDMRYTVIIVAKGDAFDPPSWWATVSAADDPGPPVPTRAALDGNYPNPFNPATAIRFELPEESEVTLRIFDMAGHSVRNLIQGRTMPRGHHETVWRGRDDNGLIVPGGVYFARFEADGVSETLRMTLLK